MTGLHPTTHLQMAGWVPDDDPERPWEDAADLAAGWIEERGRAEGAPPVLATNTFQNSVGIESLSRIARTGGHATPQGSRRFDAGPVIAYVPDARTLDLALDLARGFSLAIVETVSFPLAEWAAGAGAVNLLDGTITTSALSDVVRADLDRAVFFGGNNGWTGPHEKKHARDRLTDHIRSGVLAPEQASAYVMSQGVSGKGAVRLQQLLEKLG